MTPLTTHRTTHRIGIDAPASAVYELLADATKWPLYFTPTIHVERTALTEDGTAERIQIWALANGVPKNWTSRRDLDPQARTIAFRQEVSTAPVAAMGGTWTVVPTGANTCQLTLVHDFAAVDDDPAGVEWITNATNTNSETELANIKATAENAASLRDRELVFDGSVEIAGSAEAVYDFLYQAKLWPDRLPHVENLHLAEDVPGIQAMTMVTLAKDGSTHTTESIRVCFPGERIVYKQTTPPSLMATHLGAWVITPTADGVRVTSEHTIILREDTIAGVLGPDATLQDSRTFVTNAAGGNSKITLGHAKNFVENGGVGGDV